LEHDTHSFIVRVWCEALDDEGKKFDWRGSIEHVGTGTRHYFHELESILRVIQDQIGPKVPCDDSGQTLLARIKKRIS
jgi:hypothetical protein